MGQYHLTSIFPSDEEMLKSNMEQSLLSLLANPTQPLYVQNEAGLINFDIPLSYLPEDVLNSQTFNESSKNIGTNSSTVIHIKEIYIPDLYPALNLSRHEDFSLCNSAHRTMANRLIELFLSMFLLEDLLSLAVYCRDRINPQMFVYSYSVALLHRPDTKHLKLPPIAETFPNKFVANKILQCVKTSIHTCKSIEVAEESQVPIEIPLNFTASDVDPEHRIAYWREDMGLNLHHWHWHLVYPFEGPNEFVQKDRRGELFYYMHRQVLNRYNVERLCNNLGMTIPMMNLREPIPEAYFPKFNSKIASRYHPSRPANLKPSNIDRPGLKFTISDLELVRQRLYEAIDARKARYPNGTTVNLDDFRGIDILANMIQSSSLTPDREYYGSLHNYGHSLASFIHDPDYRYLEPDSPVGVSETGVRDPVFYRWHKHIDDILNLLKNNLTAYAETDLVFQNVSLTNININSLEANDNTLNTHWTKSVINFSRGLDLFPGSPVLVRLQHLNHDNFTYNITVNNYNNHEVMGVVRIFIAPKYDATGLKLSFNDQRLFMIEMDKFTTTLKKGENLITRSSTESAVTIPFETTFRDLDTNRPQSNTPEYDTFNFIGCGWPQHLLVPKGTKEGYPMELFVMISDYSLDKVNQDTTPNDYRNGVSFCGLRNRKYPDARSMGYPFDRIGRSGVNSMNDFLTPNMKLQQITVKFNDIIKPRQPSSNR